MKWNACRAQLVKLLVELLLCVKNLVGNISCYYFRRGFRCGTEARTSWPAEPSQAKPQRVSSGPVLSRVLETLAGTVTVVGTS